MALRASRLPVTWCKQEAALKSALQKASLRASKKGKYYTSDRNRHTNFPHR